MLPRSLTVGRARRLISLVIRVIPVVAIAACGHASPAEPEQPRILCAPAGARAQSESSPTQSCILKPQFSAVQDASIDRRS